MPIEKGKSFRLKQTNKQKKNIYSFQELQLKYKIQGIWK